jgi:hypothetical protein
VSAPSSVSQVGLAPDEAVANEVIAHGLPQRRRLSHGTAERCDRARVAQVVDRLLLVDRCSHADRDRLRDAALARLARSRASRVTAARRAAVTRRTRGWRHG